MSDATRRIWRTLAICMLGAAVMVAATRSFLPLPLSPKQVAFANSDAWLTGYVGGRGSGKTWVGAYTINKKAKGGDSWMCVSPDAGVASETTFPTFLDVTKTLGTYVSHKLSPYIKVKFRTRDGGIATIVFRSGEKPKKLHGSSMAGLWIDEASLQHPDVFLDAIPTLRHKGVMGPCLATFTPKGKINWTFETFYEIVDERLIGTDGCSADGLEWIGGRPYRPKPDTNLIHSRSIDNPFLPPQFDATLRQNMSTQLAMQELEGNFIDIAGLMFERGWFELVDEAPRDAMRVRYWDRAATPGSGSFTAGLLMARTSRGICYIEDVVRGQWSYHDRDEVIKQTAEADFRRYGGEVVIVAEQEGGSGGKQVMHEMITSLGKYPVLRDIVGGKQHRTDGGVVLPGEAKVTRALPLSGQAEAGNIKVVRGRWNQDFLDEIVSFPESSVADQVDAASGAYNKLASRIWVNPGTATKQTASVAPERFGSIAALERARSRRLFGMGERRR